MEIDFIWSDVAQSFAAGHWQMAFADSTSFTILSISIDRRFNYNAYGMTVRDVLKRLEEDGWRLARTKGSHRQYHHPAKPGTVTVAGHPSVDIPPGTLNNILKQAGLK